MRIVLLIVAAFLLQACSLSQGDPVYSKPNIRDLVGTYAVKKVSLLTSKRTELKKTVLRLQADGSYQAEADQAVANSPLVPAKSGRWEVVELYGLDLGSRPNWGVRFTSADSSSTEAFCLNATPPYNLMIDHCAAGQHFDDYLVLQRQK
ncbi:MAG TPA: hypothetical protein VFC28_04960 [Opitutaceae bacterium]|jgi:hypothetical protein|nr:hypothetical protein [Opitutaceae bacterium]